MLKKKNELHRIPPYLFCITKNLVVIPITEPKDHGSPASCFLLLSSYVLGVTEITTLSCPFFDDPVEDEQQFSFGYEFVKFMR